jgi:hypothetical protein
MFQAATAAIKKQDLVSSDPLVSGLDRTLMLIRQTIVENPKIG